MDAAVIRFDTDIFDVSKERPNPVNPIHGESLLLWLADKLKGQVAVPTPEAEDWGWYVNLGWSGRTYLVGASASEEGQGNRREWILQIEKQRSFKERLLGRERMTTDDPCFTSIKRLLESEPSFIKVSVD
jgi:hypothetical protein